MRSRAYSALLTAPENRTFNSGFLPYIYKTDSVRTADFVRRCGEHIEFCFFSVNFNFPETLHRVREKRAVRVFRFHRRADFFNRHNRARFVVDVHNAHQNRIGVHLV